MEKQVLALVAKLGPRTTVCPGELARTLGRQPAETETGIG